MTHEHRETPETPDLYALASAEFAGVSGVFFVPCGKKIFITFADKKSPIKLMKQTKFFIGKYNLQETLVTKPLCNSNGFSFAPTFKPKQLRSYGG